jgi:hypothetical protein
MKMDVERQDQDLTQPQNDHDVLEDRVMDMEMSAKGAHQMMAPIKEDLWDLNDLIANVNNQVEMILVEDVSWC